MKIDFNQLISSTFLSFPIESTLLATGRGRAKLGDEHPNTLGSINNLASLLKEQGKLPEAEQLYRECLEKSPGA